MTSGAGRHRRTAARSDSATLLLAAVLTGACGAFAWSTGTPPVPPPAPVALVAAPVAGTNRPMPARIDIAGIGVSTPLEALVRHGDGTLATPRDWNDAGWYAEGIVPGESGSAVIVGHRDSAADGPAVFYRLDELTPGDQISVTETDGSTTHFVVDSLTRVAKADFPTNEVYAHSAKRLLKLITCTGGFDPDAHSYLDNLVVTAHAV